MVKSSSQMMPSTSKQSKKKSPQEKVKKVKQRRNAIDSQGIAALKEVVKKPLEAIDDDDDNKDKIEEYVKEVDESLQVLSTEASLQHRGARR